MANVAIYNTFAIFVKNQNKYREMKPLEEIFQENRSIEEIISDLKRCPKNVQPWEVSSKFFIPENHPIKADPTLRPKPKSIKGRRVLPAKIVYPLEMVESRRMTQLAFSIPVKRDYTLGTEEEEEKNFKEAIENVYKSVRIDGVNSQRMYAYFASCEAVTIWYIVEGDTEHNKYGYPTKAKIRCLSYSPMPSKYTNIKQATFYPYFDDYGDLLALSLEYETVNGDSTSRHFDCLTKDNTYYFAVVDNAWTSTVVKNPLGKIAGVYICRPLPIYYGIDDLRNECEFNLSRESDIIGKNSSPIMKITGDLKGDDRPTGDSAREVYQLEQGGNIDMLSPQFDTQKIGAYLKQLDNKVEEITQLPNLSMENLRGLGQMSADSRRTLLMDAHQKVTDESNIMIWFLDREFSVLKSIVAETNPKWKKYVDTLSCEQIITPFMQNDKESTVDLYMKAAGTLVSQKTAIVQTGLAPDPEAEYEAIIAENESSAARERMVNVFEGAE